MVSAAGHCGGVEDGNGSGLAEVWYDGVKPYAAKCSAYFPLKDPGEGFEKIIV